MDAVNSTDCYQRSYSQVAEDLLLAHFVNKPDPLTYIDIGCFHPTYLSNTYRFYERGGRGLCIDPNPTMAPLFEDVRPRDIFVNCGVSNTEAVLTYYSYEEPVFNTFSKPRADALEAQSLHHRGRTLVGTMPIPVRPLGAVLDDVNWEGTFGADVDILSIDVENFELEVIAGIDFERVKPRAIVCETLTTSTSHRKNPIINAMQQKNYRLAGFTGHDAYFVRKTG